MSKTYHGWRQDGTAHVRVDVNGTTRALRPRLDLFNHSPTGFEWGYEGSGPAQLALAILADCLRDHRRAVRLHQQYKRAVIAYLDRDAPWAISSEQVQSLVSQLERAA